MRICIILPPAPGLFDPRTNIPLGPLYVAAVLERAGHEVVLVSLLGHDIPASWPEADLYAMGFTTPQAGAAKGILELIRSQYPDAKVLAAGAHPTAEPVQTLLLGFDSVLIGEADVTILLVLDDMPDLERIYYCVPPTNLDAIPFPARHLLPPEDLQNKASSVFRKKYEDRHIAGIMGTRGCPGKCAFCSNRLRSGTRHRSAINIVAEMQELVSLGITCFKFQDDTFTSSPKRVISLGAEAEKAFWQGQIATRIITRADTFSRRIIPALKQLNVEVVSFGIESGSQKVLDMSHKGVKIEQVERTLRLAHGFGFSTFGYFVFGLPGECEKTVDETIEFWRRNKPYLDVAVLSIFVPYAGCDIARRPDNYRMHILERNLNRYWTTQKRSVIALPYSVSFDRMIELKQKALEAFVELGYARPEWEHDL
jgi:anaerobic magnesium-protoporphyrin IX monomethyl ester cyclase